MDFNQIGSDVIIRDWVKFVRPKNIRIGSHIRIDEFVYIAGGREALTIIEDHVHIASFVSISGSAGVHLQYGSGVSHGCHIFTSNDDYVHGGLMGPTFPDEVKDVKHGRVVLGRFVVLGASTVVLPGVTIGEGATVGACSLVNKDLEPWTVNVGVPAKPIKERNKEEVLRRFERFIKNNM